MPDAAPLLQRVVIVGMSGAGKSTLARRLAQAMGAPHVELDALFWGPGWEPHFPAEFRACVQAAVQGERWVVDGNYSSVRHLVWPRATAIIWLNLSLPRVFTRVLVRTVRRAASGQVLWNGNRESWRRSFFSRESILWWVARNHAPRRRQFAALKQAAGSGPPAWIELRTPRAVDEWLSSVEGRGGLATVKA
ncbi:AAA family ATPase [Ramlibacter sp. MMS24-I3-19]|uniref:AAA family ATPase n=1 Tax=Ramlibacter sp. MMS24-I3-19 TaxID=3416606 RepID=UPI003D00B7CE